MRSILLFSALATAASLLSCSKKDNPPPTELQITILDESGAKASGATVSLYNTEADLRNQANPIGPQQTADEEGIVTFTRLSVNQYYWFAQKDCKNNLYGSFTTPDTIIPNGTTKVNTILKSTGTLNLTCNAYNPYKIYIDGAYYGDIKGKTSTSIKYYPAGNHSIRVVQISGYLLAPKDKTYTGTLSCGESLTITFPN